jgi:hypothetical protein
MRGWKKEARSVRVLRGWKKEARSVRVQQAGARELESEGDVALEQASSGLPKDALI